MKRHPQLTPWQIVVAKPIGFCTGVERALRMARKAIETNNKVYSLGPLIHNPTVVKELIKQGLRPIKDIREAKDSTLVIRSHGCAPELLKEAINLNIKIVDATCPNVAKVQRYAKELSQNGYTVVVVGDKTHPEVKSILANAGNFGIVYRTGMKITNQRIAVLAQTTASPVWLQLAVEDLLKNNCEEIRVFSTICQEAVARQQAVAAISAKVDLMFIVGGKNSANTRRLAETVNLINKLVYHIEDKREIDWDWLSKIRPRRIGIAAGTSTPASVINEIVISLKGEKIIKCG